MFDFKVVCGTEHYLNFPGVLKFFHIFYIVTKGKDLMLIHIKKDLLSSFRPHKCSLKQRSPLFSVEAMRTCECFASEFNGS